MRSVHLECVRERVLRAPIERVWEWIGARADLPLFVVNLFHASATCRDEALEVGSRVRILHRLGLARELREARISVLRPFEIAWAETRVDAEDWFPHAQRFTLTPLGPGTCRLSNTLVGSLRLPGAHWWLAPWYRRVLPRILDLENRRIARANEPRATG